MSLRRRLIVSYIMVIIISFLLAFITLVLIAQPLQNQLMRLRLTTQARSLLIEMRREQFNKPEQIIEQLRPWGEENLVHLLVLDGHGLVLADSWDTWTGRQLTDTNKKLLQLDTKPRRFEIATLVYRNGTYLYITAPVELAGQRVFVAVVASEAPIFTRFATDLGWGFLVAGAVSLLISMLVGAMMARSIALPLQDMATSATVVADGDYQHRLSEVGPLEIKHVATSFNVMIERVQASQRVMRDFVSNVSHELRTPLTSIQGFSQAIVEGATTNQAAQQKAAGIIYQEASRLTRLVEDLLDLAKLDAGQVVMRHMPLDLGGILTNTLQRLLPQAVQKQIKLVSQWDNLPPLTGDGDRLAQVFTNLLDNAIRHTPVGGQVVMAVKVIKVGGRSFVEVSVIDTGAGIPPEDLGRIFERFYQVDKSRQRGQGTGLGLAISKEIVEAHGGQLLVESEVGRGSKFMVRLP